MPLVLYFHTEGDKFNSKGNLTFWLAGTDVDVFRGATGQVFFKFSHLIILNNAQRKLPNEDDDILKLGDSKWQGFYVLKFTLFVLKAPSNGTLAMSSKHRDFFPELCSVYW